MRGVADWGTMVVAKKEWRGADGKSKLVCWEARRGRWAVCGIPQSVRRSGKRETAARGGRD